MKPTSLHVCQVFPWPYIAPIPYIDASQMTHIGSSFFVFIGHSIDILQHIAFIIWEHFSCRGFQQNGVSFVVILANGPVYNVMSGSVRKTLKLNSLFFFIYFHPREPKCNSKRSQTDRGNNNSHARNYSIVYVPVRARPRSTIEHSKIHVTQYINLI